MSAVNSVVRSNEVGVLLGASSSSCSSRSDNAPRKPACRLVGGGKVAKPNYWNWFDKFRFYFFG